MGVFDFLPGRGGDDEADEASSSGDSTTGGGEAGEPERLADLGPADFRERAEALTRRSDVPTLDFTVDSLERLDELAAGPASAVDDRVAYGSYLGEIIVRAYGGEWVDEDGWQVAVEVADDRTTVAVFDAAEMSIAADPVFAKVVAHLEAQGAERTTDASDEAADSEGEREEPAESEDGADVDDEESAGELEGDESDADRDAVADEDTVVVDADAGGDDGTNDGRASGDGEGDDDPDESHRPDDRQTPVEDETASGSAGEPSADEREKEREGTDDDDASVAPFADEDEEEEDETSDETDGEDANPDDSSEPEPRDPKVVPVYEDADASGDDAEDSTEELADEPATSPDVAHAPAESAAPEGDQAPIETGADDADEPAVPDRSVLRAAADELADGWPSRDLDFTPGSLPRLDALVDDQWEGRFRTRSLADRDVDHESARDPLVQIGAYYGEVLVRWLDGEWVATDDGEGAVTVPDVGETVARVDVFAAARECLIPSSTFAYRYDALVNRLSVDEVPVSDGRADVFDGDRDALTSGDVITQFAATAETFVERWPEYPLDYSPRSVRALDEIADRLADDVDADGASLADETDPRSLWLTARATTLGAYYAAVLLRHRDAQWRIDGDVELVVDRAVGERTVDPVRTAADCLRGEGSFVETYASLDD